MSSNGAFFGLSINIDENIQLQMHGIDQAGRLRSVLKQLRAGFGPFGGSNRWWPGKQVRRYLNLVTRGSESQTTGARKILRISY